MADFYGPTVADLKLPKLHTDLRSKSSNVVGLKKYNSGNDALVSFNVAADLATGTGTGVSTQKQSYYDAVSDAKAVNTVLTENGHNRVGNNNDYIHNTVYLPN